MIISAELSILPFISENKSIKYALVSLYSAANEDVCG